MGNLFNPEIAGELRAFVEFFIPGREQIVGRGVINIENAINSPSDIATETPVQTLVQETASRSQERPAKLSPEQLAAAKNNIDRQRPKTTANVQPVKPSAPARLDINKARQTLKAVYESGAGYGQ